MQKKNFLTKNWHFFGVKKNFFWVKIIFPKNFFNWIFNVSTVLQDYECVCAQNLFQTIDDFPCQLFSFINLGAIVWAAKWKMLERIWTCLPKCVVWFNKMFYVQVRNKNKLSWLPISKQCSRSFCIIKISINLLYNYRK